MAVLSGLLFGSKLALVWIGGGRRPRRIDIALGPAAAADADAGAEGADSLGCWLPELGRLVGCGCAALKLPRVRTGGGRGVNRLLAGPAEDGPEPDSAERSSDCGLPNLGESWSFPLEPTETGGGGTDCGRSTSTGMGRRGEETLGDDDDEAIGPTPGRRRSSGGPTTATV